MNRPATLEKLAASIPLIAPSMLKCDFGNLHREVELLEAAGAAVLHLDVMDGHFVPNLSYGPMVIERLRDLTNLVLDAHLMISEPARYLDDYLNAGCDCVTFHVEAEPEPLELLKRIRSAGAVSGLALNPGTPLAAVEGALSECDMVLVMSVEPGFGGQKFKPVAIEKLRQLAQKVVPGTLLSIDGGIGPATIEDCATAGAQVFVAGSAIFDSGDYAAAMEDLVEKASPHVVSLSSRQTDVPLTSGQSNPVDQ